MLFSFPFFPSLYFFFCEVKKMNVAFSSSSSHFLFFILFKGKLAERILFFYFFFLKPHIDQVILLMPELTRVIFLQQFSRGSQVSRGTAWLYYVSLLLELLKPFCPFLGRILSFMQVEPISAQILFSFYDNNFLFHVFAQVCSCHFRVWNHVSDYDKFF